MRDAVERARSRGGPASPTASLGTLTVTSRMIVVLPTVRVSTAPTIPPASPIAEASTPNEPGVFGRLQAHDELRADRRSGGH